MVPKISLIVALLCYHVNTELFTAIVEMEPLLETHQRIIVELDNYIEMEEKRLRSLKKHLNQYKKEHNKAMDDIPNYLGNPINAFTLIKRLTTDMDLMKESMKKGTEYLMNITMNHTDLIYPSMEDLTGAAQALTRLQETYQLNVNELSEGLLNGVEYSTPMTADECFELGKTLYNENDFKNAIAWMTEALRKYKEYEDETYSFTEVDILDYIGFSHYLLGDVKTALEWTYKLLVIEPNHKRALGNVQYFTKTIKEQEETIKNERRLEAFDPEEVESEPADKDGQSQQSVMRQRKIYEALCRGEMEVPTQIKKRLKCWYSNENHPFLKYAPIKTEQMYIKPDVFIFYEVLSDNEIEVLKYLAMPRFARAVVIEPGTGAHIKTKNRISKSSWLKDEEAPEIARISQRVTDMTGLSTISAEHLQVVNYGLGGHYVPHYDFSMQKDLFVDRLGGLSGNRIATVLFYMSDVSQGGATVFTELGLSVFPIKGAAAFWLNLHPSGEGDMATKHAACPVLRGSKWAANKWIHEREQEFRKPCNLHLQEATWPLPALFKTRVSAQA